MGEILGIGCSHGLGPPETLTEIYLKMNLRSELTPAHLKDPNNATPSTDTRFPS